MAKKKSINKSQAVRDYLSGQPDAMPKEVIAALAKKGIEVSRILVSTVKSKVNKTGTAKKVSAAVATVPAVVEKPSNGSTITLEQVKKVAHTINTLGGIQRVTEVLAVIKELGGVKKFKELAEAMSVTATEAIPY